MRRMCTAIIYCIALFLFSGCIRIPVSPPKAELKLEEILSIEVYYFEEPVYDNDFDRNEGGKWEQYSYTDEGEIVIPYEAEPIASVKKEDYAQFLADYEGLPFTMLIIIGAVDPSRFYTGYIVKINTAETYYLYTSSCGGSLAYCKDEVWEEFLKKYIGEEPFQRVEESKKASNE